MNLEQLQIYLPKYLSSASEKELFSGLKGFPDNIDERIYTSYLKESPLIYQGDGLKEMLIVNLPSLETKQAPAMVLSNTCDIDPANQRNFDSQVVYTPIVSLEKYVSIVLESTGKSRAQIDSHLTSIRKQFITQIFYLPAYGDILSESIVFLDRILNIGNQHIDRDSLSANRIFSLSDYGNYLFLYKLSLHFTRIQDKVDRRSSVI